MSFAGAMESSVHSSLLLAISSTDATVVTAVAACATPLLPPSATPRP